MERIEEKRKIIIFLSVVTIISSILGFLFILFIDKFGKNILETSRWIVLFVGIFLMITAVIRVYISRQKKDVRILRDYRDINTNESIILGIAQSFFVFPGLSLSILNVPILLMQGFRADLALRLGLLMSLPIFFGGNIILNINILNASLENIIALIISFIFGYMMIAIMMRIAKKINFEYFVFIMAVLAITSYFI